MMPPLLYDRPAPLEFVLAVVVPLVFGALVGLALGWSSAAYTGLLLVAFAGGFGAGFEHDVPLEGTYRGLLGGLLFTTGLLVAHGLADVTPVVTLPDPEVLLLVVNGAVGAATGTVGALLRRRATA
jgi:hypothetical protein